MVEHIEIEFLVERLREILAQLIELLIERIGKRIKELREAKKMEARDLAILTGIDAANLSRIEQGKYSTGVDILSRICVILDAHLDLIPNSQKEA